MLLFHGMEEGQNDPAPIATDKVLDALRNAAAEGLSVSRRCQTDLNKYEYDIDDVCDLLADCTEAEIHKHEYDELYPEREDYMVIVRLELEAEPFPFYVKVALHLPEMVSGRLVSFKFWGS